MELIDFDKCQRVKGRGYRGNAGRKLAYMHDEKVWMVKFPGTTKDMVGKHLPSYTSSPLSEYVGSQIYELLGVPVHETVLGKCQGKIVVGCRDFTDRGQLLEYSQIKNMVDDELISGSYGSSGQGERLSDVLRVIETSEEFEGIRDEVRCRFWDMFVIDAFIHNNDRNNGNWGLLVGNGESTLAPVFDNGNAFFNKRNPSVFGRRLNDDRALKEDALSGKSFFLDDDDKRINPLEYISKSDNAECKKALSRFIDKVDMDKVRELIEEIPEEAYGLTVVDSEQKRFYIELLNETYNDGIQPIAKSLGIIDKRVKQPSLDELCAEIEKNTLPKSEVFKSKDFEQER